MATQTSVSLSVGRGEKLPVSKGAGLTEKGRAARALRSSVNSNPVWLMPRGFQRISDR